MLNRKEFLDFSASLSSLSFADDVVVALARTLKTGTLRPEDEQLMRMAQNFFADVISGYRWSDNPAVSKASIQSAAAFSAAVNAIAISMPVESSTEFIKYIERLRAAAEELYEKHKASREDLRTLQDFFTAYGYSELERSDDIANRKGKYKTGSWLTGAS